MMRMWRMMHCVVAVVNENIDRTMMIMIVMMAVMVSAAVTVILLMRMMLFGKLEVMVAIVRIAIVRSWRRRNRIVVFVVVGFYYYDIDLYQ
jgi:hypothetical protein